MNVKQLIEDVVDGANPSDALNEDTSDLLEVDSWDYYNKLDNIVNKSKPEVDALGTGCKRLKDGIAELSHTLLTKKLDRDTSGINVGSARNVATNAKALSKTLAMVSTQFSKVEALLKAIISDSEKGHRIFK